MTTNPILLLTERASNRLREMALQIKDQVVADGTKSLIASAYSVNDLSFGSASEYVVEEGLTVVDTIANVADKEGNSIRVRVKYDVTHNQLISHSDTPSTHSLPTLLTRFVAFMEDIDVTAGIPGIIVSAPLAAAPAPKVSYGFVGYTGDEPVTLQIGDSEQLVIDPISSGTISYQSTSTGVAQVTSTGMVKAIAKGTTVITAGPLNNAVEPYITICVIVS